jgi:hypothetical protein
MLFNDSKVASVGQHHTWLQVWILFTYTHHMPFKDQHNDKYKTTENWVSLLLVSRWWWFKHDLVAPTHQLDAQEPPAICVLQPWLIFICLTLNVDEYSTTHMLSAVLFPPIWAILQCYLITMINWIPHTFRSVWYIYRREGRSIEFTCLRSNFKQTKVFCWPLEIAVNRAQRQRTLPHMYALFGCETSTVLAYILHRISRMRVVGERR